MKSAGNGKIYIVNSNIISATDIGAADIILKNTTVIVRNVIHAPNLKTNFLWK